MGNMAIYDEVKIVPESARKTIQGGRLKGMTDINPMWRIEKLTEVFGPCGVGWYYEIVNKWMEPGAGGEIAAFCDINLYIKENGEWSRPIPGTGGSMFVSSEKNGPYTSDECYKMALTDAISVACKALGMAANIYWDKDRTKYSQTRERPTGGDPKVTDEQILKCADCGAKITVQVHDFSARKYRRPLCIDCQKKQ